MKLINQLKQHDSARAVDVDLELGLMQTICTFKSSVLGDPRILLLGSTAKEEAVGQRKHSDNSLDEAEHKEAVELHQWAKIDSETR